MDCESACLTAGAPASLAIPSGLHSPCCQAGTARLLTGLPAGACCRHAARSLPRTQALALQLLLPGTCCQPACKKQFRHALAVRQPSLVTSRHRNSSNGSFLRILAIPVFFPITCSGRKFSKKTTSTKIAQKVQFWWMLYSLKSSGR